MSLEKTASEPTLPPSSLPLRAQNFLPRGDCSLSEFVSITAREHLSKIIIRAYDKDALLRLAKIFGCDLPRNNKVVSPKGKDYDKDCELLWLGPNELLLRTLASEQATDAYSRVVALEAALQEKGLQEKGLQEKGLQEKGLQEQGLKATHFSLVDVSDYYVVARVAGSRARVILQKNCPLDFHPSVFQVGDCAQSIYAKGTALFSCPREDTFDLQIRISLAGYLWSMLELSTRSERD